MGLFSRKYYNQIHIQSQLYQNECKNELKYSRFLIEFENKKDKSFCPITFSH
jgi:hypothetical protein